LIFSSYISLLLAIEGIFIHVLRYNEVISISHDEEHPLPKPPEPIIHGASLEVDPKSGTQSMHQTQWDISGGSLSNVLSTSRTFKNIPVSLGSSMMIRSYPFNFRRMSNLD
jgi:hypothetical protein